ncbi:restriction endonuclease [Chryseobacterium lactis]|uniref:Restriction endonuclease n=1 Tax=Chryseobacterium lactis TaxID=1241981 RepID=A0A3G6RHW7_CHRLC|nr:restriction endonuclease [Chryseobacterium lactis]AZA82226.1 restriction endonuclease [Chryseobacterium lactis]AZB02607.1 restriction endonuclease [Chryseobacterium lactis]PNW14099.1 restriction endonuclease [Chryseobacterium lactis]
MFLNTQAQHSIEEYHEKLKAIGALSKLFSESDKPYIQYRIAENIFCDVFNAENLARADGAYDAVINKFGIGIKTFVLNGNSKVEKVAEFNADSSLLRTLRGMELAKKLADLRNERILIADRAYDTNNRVYHIIGRDKGVIKIFEDSYDLVDKESIEIISDTAVTLKFKDTFNEYTFNHSKSVLMKRFVVPDNCQTLEIEILNDPISLLRNAIANPSTLIESISSYTEPTNQITQNELAPGEDYIILPLYSAKRKASRQNHIVPEKSQLNQWNAGGRARDYGEVYIPIPADIRDLAPNFLPPREVPFTLVIPSGEELSAKVCQDNGKALMTNPNNALSDWMLRDILNLGEGEILTYDRLIEIGYDSVKITKTTDNKFYIDFTKLDEYETFLEAF